jgi:flagellar hook assembly protein FlgD
MFKRYLPLFLAATLCAASAHAISITPPSLSNTNISSETNPLKSGTTVSFTIDGPGQVDVVFSQVNNGALTPVATVTQVLAGAGPVSVFWPALWLIGTDAGRQDGHYVYQVTPSTAGTAGTPLPATGDPSAIFQITSVDIHSLKVTPSLDSNQQPTFPFTITYSLAKAAKVTVGIYNSNGALVRTIISGVTQADETVSSPSIRWDGRDATGNPVPIGIYTSTVTATDAFVPTEQATPKSATFSVLSQAGAGADPQHVFESNTYVYPNPVRGTGTFVMEPVRDGATLHLKIYTITGTLVLNQTFTGNPTGSIFTYSWPLTNQAGNKVGRGLYYYEVREDDAVGTLQTVKKMAVIP